MDNELDKLIDLFDTALTSDNAAVQNALKTLLMVTILAQSEDKVKEIQSGPFKQLFDRVSVLERSMVGLVKQNQTYGVGAPPLYPSTNPTPPNWAPVTPNTGDPLFPPWNVTCKAEGFTEEFLKQTIYNPTIK